MSRWTPLVLKLVTFVLVIAILATVAAITRYAVFADKLNAPRTEIERALLLAVQAVKSNPNDAQARIKLAAVYLEMGRASTAVNEAKTATKLAPDNAEAFYILGLANKEIGNIVQAAQNLEKAAKMEGQLAPFYQTCWTELARLHESQKKYKLAIRAYEAALGYGPESAPILYSLAKAYESSGDIKNAETYYKEALEFVPDYEEAAKALERLKNESADKKKPEKPAADTKSK